tara:strand:- start:1191 stop:1550 length:360 start_codon:yes stop_codon:yes gene_type:complete
MEKQDNKAGFVLAIISLIIGILLISRHIFRYFFPKFLFESLFFTQISIKLMIYSIFIALGGLTLGIVSFIVIKKNKNKKGKKLAIAGIVLNGLSFAISAFFWIFFIYILATGQFSFPMY